MPEPMQLVDRRTVDVTAAPEAVFAEIERLGGAAGWPVADPLWRIRGWIDGHVGGVGMARGRRDPEHLEVGDHLDFWSVETIERPRLLRLRAEMRVPGRAWLQFEVEPCGAGARLVQSAIFEPAGVPGYAYWYGLLGVHLPIFRGMVRVLARRAASRRVADVRTTPSET